MLIGKYKRYIVELRATLRDYEQDFTQDNITLREFVDSVEEHIRLNSMLNTHLGTLFHKYIIDFCNRYDVETYPFQNWIRNYRSLMQPQFDGEWYFSEARKRK